VEPKEYHAKTVDLAIRKACEDLGVTSKDLEINVITNGYRGIFGLVGGKDARILVSLKMAQQENRESLIFKRPTSMLNEESLPSENSYSVKALKAKETLEEILNKASFSVSVQVIKDEETILLDINGDNEGLLIGKNGQTLDALQFIVNKIVNRFPEDRKRVVIDASGYREKHIHSLTEMALRMGKKAKKIRKPVIMGPMNPHDRRIVHITLKNDTQLTTKSHGEGTIRKIIIYPKKSTNFEQP